VRAKSHVFEAFGEFRWSKSDSYAFPESPVLGMDAGGRMDNGGEKGRDGDGGEAFDAAGIFRPTNFQNSICRQFEFQILFIMARQHKRQVATNAAEPCSKLDAPSCRKKRKNWKN
jgi:hypothetical protein